MASDAPSSIEAAPSDDFLYQLASVDQSLERARSMISQASVMVLFDIFPAPFDELKDLFVNAHQGGIVVAGTVYEPADDQRFDGAVFLAPMLSR